MHCLIILRDQCCDDRIWHFVELSANNFVSQAFLHLTPGPEWYSSKRYRNIHNNIMAPPPIHVHDHNARFPHIEKHDGWGIQAGRLPMYSPVWTNDKGWANKLASDFSSSLAELPMLFSRYLPFSQGPSMMTGRRPMTMAHGSSNFLFILLCGLWYSTSALSSNTGKAILNQFRYPITLTFVQFGFVAFYCLLFMSPAIRFTRMRKPSRAILRSTFPMGLFQVGGHIFSSIAISRIPVSTVHTIKVSGILPFKFSLKILSFLSGSITLIYCCGLRSPFRSKLLEQNLYLTPSPNHRRHVGMLVRRFCL